MLSVGSEWFLDSVLFDVSLGVGNDHSFSSMKVVSFRSVCFHIGSMQVNIDWHASFEWAES